MFIPTTPISMVVSSIPPFLMRERQAVQYLPILPPIRHVNVHEAGESIVVPSLDQVREFVCNDVFEAWPRLLGEVSIQADVACGRITTSPLRSHSLSAVSISSIKPLTVFA